MADVSVERFAPAGGRVTGTIGLIAVVVVLVMWFFESDELPLLVPAVAIAIGVLMWATMLRPRVWLTDDTLVLRNMLETIHIPLAAIDDVAVRQVLAVQVGGHRYVSPGVGRSLRQVLRGSGQPGTSGPGLGPAGEPTHHLQDAPYADFVEDRIRDAVDTDRRRRGVGRYSPEADELGTQVRREPAWPEIVALAAAVAFFAFAIIV